jgi:putative ABC transport system permease protein
MPLFLKARSFLRNLFSARRVETDLNQEVRSHLELLIDENIHAGMSPSEAQRAARIELGGFEQVKEQVREERLGNWLHSVFSDFRYGFRQLYNNPGFTFVAVVTLALGIALNATIFSLVSAFLLRRPPGREPERVVVVTSVNPASGFQSDASAVSVPNYLDWRESNDVFADMAAADEYRTANLTSPAQSQALHAAAVSPNFFRVLDVPPEFGRTFADGEGQSGRDRVVILSHELWERQFGSDCSLLGHIIRINRENYTVIGVMPASFRWLGFPTQLWTPLVIHADDQSPSARKDRSLFLFARLKSSVTVDQARAVMITLARRAEERFPETEKGWGVALRTLPDFLIYSFGIRSGLGVMTTTVGFVLMIACANVAGLVLARAVGRRKELAVRIALGAGRLRIIRQLLTENLLIALLGGTLGLLLAYWGIHFLRAALAFNEAIRAVPVSLDWNVALFTLTMSFACAVVCGIAPALNASRTDINTNLQGQGRGASAGRSHSRLRTLLVTSEITLALFLLVGSGLLMRGIFLVEHQSLGFRMDHLLTAGVTLDDARYREPEKQALFVRDLISRLKNIPGTEAVAVTSDLPATGGGSVSFRIKGQPDLADNQQRTSLDIVATADYLAAAGIPLLRGRNFTEADIATSPQVVLVNEEFVRQHMKDQEPLGQQIRLAVSGATSEWREIVGVVGNVKTHSEGTRIDPQVYEPFLQRPIGSFSVMIRTTSDPGNLSSNLRDAVALADPELPLDRVMSMTSVVDYQKGGDTLFARLMGGFALLALLLAAIGIYGLIAYSVGQRTHEIGIRMALGANAPDVVRVVLWEGLKMTAVGGAIGIALALPLPKLFEAMFYDVHLGEPRLYFIAPTAILAVAMLATYIPARRASRVDPNSALRQE